MLPKLTKVVNDAIMLMSTCMLVYDGVRSIPNHLLYKTIYWQGINIGDWRFFRKLVNIKIANINNYMDTPTKPLQKLKKKDMVAQIANIKSANCFLQTNSPNITFANKYSCTVYYHKITYMHGGIRIMTSIYHYYAISKEGYTVLLHSTIVPFSYMYPNTMGICLLP